jgi:glucokinase
VVTSAVAFDLGGTWLRATTEQRGVAGLERIRLSSSITPAELGEQIWQLAVAVSGERAPAPDVITIAVPTFVSSEGRLLDCPALPSLSGARLADLVRHRWVRGSRTSEVQGPVHDSGPSVARLPEVRVIPDIAAAALGEAAFGTGRGVPRFLCVAIGTGANAAAVIDGHLLTTVHGCLGDAGHVVIEPDGLACTCGGRGCLETRASGWALDREAAALGLAGAAALVSAAVAGEPRAARALARAGVALGCAMATWSVLIWPDVIAVAGGVSQAGESLLEPAREALARHAPPYVGGMIRVVVAQLGSDATLVGSLALSKEPGSDSVARQGI